VSERATASDVDPGTAAALAEVHAGQVLGLGTGRAAEAFVRALGARVRGGLAVRGVATSERTAALAREQQIPLLTLEEAGTLDVTFDGADEFDPRLDVIKGYGGALVREKIVAASSRRFVVLVGPEKRVPVLGSRGQLPVEVLPFGEALCRTRLRALGCAPERRMGADGSAYVTDNGNHILDCKVAPIQHPAELERDIRDIPGAVGTGLFLGMADLVIVNHGDRAEVLARSR
jgi:ribose 5-phosphate isomerase A